MSSLKVVPLRDVPLLNDVPGRLRALADELERESAPVQSCYVVMTQPDAFLPDVRVFGENKLRRDRGRVHALRAVGVDGSE